uniref:Uncharacterized protein n=1 Tax=Nelumbo nucifera TaxID=4432 RepID=A0A822YF58_NELNU|nr:TPA_asm: hypothetical protein HUJ06_031347 [Nelumbo nucifera]
MTMDRNQRSENAEAAGRGGAAVAIECLKGSSNADEWNGNLLQTGDIVEELKIGSYMCVRSPFKNGKSGVQRLLHDSFKKKVTSIQVRVRRGTDEFIELQACIVPNESAGRKQYMLRSIGDPNYAVGFADRTEIECLELQGKTFDFLSLPRTLIARVNVLFTSVTCQRVLFTRARTYEFTITSLELLIYHSRSQPSRVRHFDFDHDTAEKLVSCNQ